MHAYERKNYKTAKRGEFSEYFYHFISIFVEFASIIHYFPQNFFNILEIGAALFDVYDYGVINTFQQYVRPTRFPKLSDKFVKHFNLTQADLYGQPNIQQALPLLYQWLDNQANYPMLYNPGFICTWFSNDLGTILPHEADVKRLKYRNSLRQWIDVSRVVRVCIFISSSFPILSRLPHINWLLCEPSFSFEQTYKPISMSLHKVAKYFGTDKLSSDAPSAVEDASTLAMVVQRFSGVDNSIYTGYQSIPCV